MGEVEREIECDECEGKGEVLGFEDRFDPTLAGGHYTVDCWFRCKDCNGSGRRAVRLHAPCALCNEREADPTVAVFVGGSCCRACAEDVDAQLGGVEPDALPFEYGYGVELPRVAVGGAR